MHHFGLFFPDHSLEFTYEINWKQEHHFIGSGISDTAAGVVRLRFRALVGVVTLISLNILVFASVVFFPHFEV